MLGLAGLVSVNVNFLCWDSKIDLWPLSSCCSMHSSLSKSVPHLHIVGKIKDPEHYLHHPTTSQKRLAYHWTCWRCVVFASSSSMSSSSFLFLFFFVPQVELQGVTVLVRLLTLNIRISVVSHVRLADWPAGLLHGENLNAGHNTQTFQTIVFIPVILKGTIDFYHLIPLSLILILPCGHKVSSKQTLLASSWTSWHYFWVRCNQTREVQ